MVTRSWLTAVYRRLTTPAVRPRPRGRHTNYSSVPAMVSVERVEPRVMLTDPDLVGFDFRPNGFPTAYFHVEEASPSWGDQIHLDFAVANLGATPPATQNFNIAFYLSADSTITTSDFLFGSITRQVPNSGAGFSSQAIITLPGSNPLSPLSTGPYYFGIIVDSNNTVVESNETNNSNQGESKDLTSVLISSPVAVVTDSVGSSTDHALNFGSIVNDGTGNSLTTQTITLSDGAARSLLKVPQNGVHLLNDTNFHIVSILSNKASQAVNVAGGTSLIAANSSETWTIQVSFDPTANGALTDTLQIQTDDPTNPTINIALSGTGTPLANLRVTDSAGPTTDQTVNFGDVGVDGVNGTVGQATVTLTNNGSGLLTINQNGISLPAGPFSVTSITSSTQGAINLATGSKTIAAGNAETWTVNLRFDPTATGLFQVPLTISSDDPDAPSTVVSLLGTGKTLPHLSVLDSVAPVGDLAVAFGGVHADGTGKQLGTQTVTLANTGELPLQVNQNGITLDAGTQFKIASIVSSTQGTINLSSGIKTIAASSAETWTVTLQFDPSAIGVSSDTLRIASNDSASPTSVALSGTGLNQPQLVVTDSDSPNSDLAQSFGPTLNDGTGGRISTRTLQLTNVGTQSLVVSQNGISLLGGTEYQIVSLVSSTSGAVNLAGGSATIAPTGNETWTATVAFDPHSTASLTDTLRIASNDPINPTINVALSGQGVVPAVNAVFPSQLIHVSAGSPYRISWNGSYAPGTATFNLYYDTDTNPANGLVAIATALPQTQSSYDWQVPTGLVGGTYKIYVTMQEGGVTVGSYAPGSLIVDATGSDRLLSAPVTDQAAYTLSYVYNGTTYNTPYTLAVGENILYATAVGATHEYHVTRAATLVDHDHTTHDELGNVTSTTDANGETITYQYDQLSRVTHIAYPDGSTVDYTYDPAGNVLTMRDKSGWQLYSYDARTRLTSVTYSPTNNVSDPSALTIGYEYDLASRLTALVYPSGKRVEYGYDNANRLTTVTEKNSGQSDLVTTYAYSATTGLLTTTTRPNDTQTVNTYDANGRLIDILHRRTSNSALILQYHYTLDNAGRRTQVVVTTQSGVRAEAYVYDELDRLTQVAYSDDNGTIDATDKVVKYTYDKNGNRLTMATYNNGIAAGATETLTYAYGFENRLLTVTDQNSVVQARYVYDWRGNQIQKVTPITTTLYGYDCRNLLTSVDDGTNHIEYQYDGAGRRLGKTANGIETQFLVDPLSDVYQTIEERDSEGESRATFIYGLNRIAGYTEPQLEATYYLSDVIGSVGGTTSDDGSDFGVYKYDAFGETRAAPPNDINSYQFAGESNEPTTGLIYLRARSYDPRTGRFLQKDPMGFTDGPSMFPYAANNPVNNIDPKGLDDQPDPYLEKLRELFPGVPDGPLPSPPIVDNFLNNITAGAYFGGNARGEGIAVGSPEWNAADHAQKFAIFHDKWQVQHNGQGFGLADLWKGAQAASTSIPAFTSFIGTLGQLGLDAAGDAARGILGALRGPSSDLYESTARAADLPSWFDDNRYFPFFPPGGPGGAIGFPDIGGVLIDQAATLVGANINDITGATFDPVSHQLVFLGSSNPATLHDVNLDLFTTAIQSVYGSAVPPYVTLDPPAKLLQQSFNLGNGDGVILDGKAVAVPIKYTPYTPTQSDDMTLSFRVNGSLVTVRLDAQVLDGTNGNGNVSAGGRHVVLLKLGNVTGLPAGVTITQPTFSTVLNGTITAGNSLTVTGGDGYTLTVNAREQDSNFYFTLNNNSGAAVNVTNLQLITDLQHRKLGGRTENTRLGWIMEEADRVMKELGGGKDQLTNAIYDSNNAALPAGFQNLLERYVANNQSGSFSNRFWFTPNLETLKQYIDPATGEATVVFDQSSVKLNTEALILGQPEDIVARAFADYFNAHYDELAQVSFPVHDPHDPTGNTVINVRIFEELRDAMKAVAIARFFHDNNIPLDTWWLNSWTPPIAYVPATIPTLTNSLTSGAVTINFYGGVQIKTPNTYLPDAVAKSISDAVKAQRATVSGDLGVQSWSVNTATPVGNLNAVAASLDAQKQDANVTLGAADLSFASPGGRQLLFDRYYNSGYLGDTTLGLGWRATPFDLQFQLPTFVDDARLMRDSNGNALTVTGATSDTLLRSGEIRLIDHATGKLLNFFSSLTTAYALDSQGNPVLGTSGLSAGGVPTFTAGQYQDGSTLTQSSSTKNYTLTRTDGSTLVFDAQGNLLTTTTAAGYAITYGYANGRLSQITDSAGQKLTITYGSNGRIQYVTGPESSGNASRRIAYTYDPSGTLTKVETQALQSGGTYTTTRTTQYLYNTSNQLTGVIGPDGLTRLTNTPDIRGRSDQSKDALGNMIDNHFTVDGTTGNRTTQTTDVGTTGVNDPTAHANDALKYFAAGSTNTTGFDGTARTTQSVDALGNTTHYGYNGNSLLPNSVTLPTPGRAAISIQRNAANLPTAIHDPANAGGTPIQIAYNAANLPTQATDSKGIVTKYTYTAWNALATVTVAFGTPLAATTTNNYNARKLLQNVVDPLGHTVVSYTYDSLDRIKTVTDGAGLTTTYDYDAIGRLKRVYDPRLTGAANYVEYAYNDNDQVTQLATPTGNITYQYDAATHRLMSQTDLTGSTTQYAYDAATGLMTSITQVSAGGNATTQYLYDRLGAMAAMISPEGLRTSFRHDALGQSTDVIEDNNTAPTSVKVSEQATSANTMTVQVTTSEPILVASLKYWQDGQSIGTAQTQSLRLNDQVDFAFALTGVDPSHHYRYELTLTDRVGLSQTLPQGMLNAPPLLAAVGSSAVTYTENNPGALIASTLIVSDVDDANLIGATVQITGNYQNGQDLLVFTNTATITGTWDAAIGALVLTGTDTVANYQAALRSVKYRNLSDNPSLLTRTVSLLVNDGAITSNGVSRTINVMATNDGPVLTGIETAPLAYTENALATALTSSLVVSDADHANLVSARLRITGNYQNGQDLLVFTNTATITGTWDAATGALVLTGTDTVANYQAALRSVKYRNLSENPSLLTRTVSLLVNDGTINSNVVSRTINLTTVNDGPVLTGIETAPLAYTENAIVALTASTVVSDADHANLVSARLRITGNYQNGQDLLVFTNTATITGTWDAATGALVLTGTDTVANYQAALRSAKYRNLSDNPSLVTRTVSLLVNDGMIDSNTVTRNINLTAVNDGPVLTGIETTPLAYTENATIALTASTVVSDPDNANLTGGRVKISTNYQNGQDVLSFVNTATITGTWDAATGTLILSGTDTIANYQAALRSVQYLNTSHTPSTLTRTVLMLVNDGTINSNVVSRGITVTAVNDAPVLSGIEAGALSYFENAAPTSVTSSIVASDLDNTNLTSAQVQITGNYQNGEDVLSFVNTATITGNWNAATGTLTLTGTDTLINYALAVRSVKYHNTSNAPSTLPRTVQFLVNDGTADSNKVTRTVNVTALNDAPTLTGIEGTPLAYTAGDPATNITSMVTVVDVDSPNLASARIKISANYKNGQDILSFTNTATITSAWDASTGTLVLSGTDTVANYEAALRSVQYRNTSATPNTSTRTVIMLVNDGVVNSNLATRNITVAAAIPAFPASSVSVTATTIPHTGSSPFDFYVPSLAHADDLSRRRQRKRIF